MSEPPTNSRLRLETEEEPTPASGRVPSILATLWSTVCALGAIGALLSVIGGIWLILTPADGKTAANGWILLLLLVAQALVWAAACAVTLRAANRLRTGVRPSLVLPAVLTVVALLIGGIGLHWIAILQGLLALGLMIATIVTAQKITTTGDHA